ncbi:MAG: MFS transporter [Calditrichia bacterium]
MQSDKQTIFGWTLYDWANSAFATTIMAAVLPVFYSTVAAGRLPANIASSYWGYTNTIAMLAVAFSAPVLGAIADFKTAKKKFLGVFAAAGILGSILLGFVGQGQWMLASAFYVIGRIGFANANIFYDSLLPHITTAENRDQVSAQGYAVGYLGGGILLAINLIMITKPQWFLIPDAESAIRYSFISVGLWWAVFSIPLFRWVAEPAAAVPQIELRPLQAGFMRLRYTFSHLRNYRQAARFLLAFWLYNDGVGTIIVMAVIFGAEIGISQTTLIGAILAVQFAGAPFSIAFGRLAALIGAKRAIYIGLLVYMLIAAGGYFLKTDLHFWILALAVATVQGGTQALSRSLFSRLTPPEKSAEFFGFYDVSNKFSGILGPAVFGLVSQFAGNSRLGIVALLVFFICGFLVLTTVNVKDGEAAAFALDD